MAHQTGTMLGPVAMLQLMSTFLAANGWTVDNDSVEGTGRKLTVHRGSAYYAMRASDAGELPTTIGVPTVESNVAKNGIWMVGGSGITGPNWYDITGRVTHSGLARYILWMDWNNAPYVGQTYHMFAHTTPTAEFYLAVEYEAGRWVWLCFSETMNMLGDWGQGTNPSTGAFMGASRGPYWTNQPPDDTGNQGVRGPFHDQGSSNNATLFVRCDDPTTHIEQETFAGYIDPLTGVSPWHQIGNRFSGSQPERYGYTGRHFITSAKGMGSNLVRAAPTQHNLADVFTPFILMRERPGFFPLNPSGNWTSNTTLTKARSMFGYPSHIYHIDMTNRNPGDTLIIGSDTWRLFPDHYKGQLNMPDTWGLSNPDAGYAIRQ